MNLLDIKDQSKYTEIPKITKKLLQKAFEIQQGNKIIQLSWLSSAEYDKGTGMVELEFSPKLKPYMLGLKEFFTTYQLRNILELTCKYSIRLYEIFKSNEYRQTLKMELIELFNILKLSKAYSEYFDLKKRILEPAKKELSEKTDIEFDYKPIKTGRKVTALKFIIKHNPRNKQVLDIEKPLTFQNQVKLQNNDILDDMKANVQAIQSDFYRQYKGKLIDKFVKEMLVEKGYPHTQKCIAEYEYYIQGRNIKSIEGDFYSFVMNGYNKPTPHKGNKPQRDNFEQREYTRAELEKYYVDLTK